MKKKHTHPIPFLAKFPIPTYKVLTKWRPRRKLTLVDWIRHVEGLIYLYSTPARTKGKYKGHGSTSLAWLPALCLTVDRFIKATRRGKTYDGNMAAAAFTGYVLCQWFLHVQRAKCYDANRPLGLRRKAFQARRKWLEMFVGEANNDAVIGKVWAHQQLSPPYGNKAKGGKFI